MGEIGIPRREYLYDLQYWEIVLIARGYWRRHHHGWEQARLVAYNARFCMGSKDPVPTITNWLRFPWEDDEHHDPMTEEEIAEMQAEMKAINAQMKEKSE